MKNCKVQINQIFNLWSTSHNSELIELCIVYREWNLLLYIVHHFKIYPPINKKHSRKLTVENVCIVYEKALERDDQVNHF